MRSINSKVWGMPCPKTGIAHYHALLVLKDKDREIRELVVCNSLDKM